MKTLFGSRFSAGFVGSAMALSMVFQMPAAGQTESRKIALLVGVGDYIDPSMRDLQGPPHDVTAMREVLVSRWGFRAQDVRTLVDHGATRANIIAELAAIEKRSTANDEVLVYFSGHGTSAADANLGSLGIPLPHGTGAFVPADFKLGPGADARDLIVGKTDLVPVFSALEAKGRRIWMISDSCYSGNQVRSVQVAKQDELPEKMIPLVFGKAAKEQRADLALADTAAKPEPYPYRSTSFLSASSASERAKDIPQSMLGRYPTLDGKPHGALTDALLRVLSGQIPSDLDGDGLLTLNEVHRATSDFMALRAYGHSPMRLPSVTDDLQGLGKRPVLNVRGVALAPTVQTFKPLRVRADNIPSGLNAAISGVPDVQLVKAGDAADIVVLVRQGQFGVLAASGDVLADMPMAETERAAGQIRQLAWAHRLRGLAEKYRRGALEVDVDPSAKGGNFVPGDLISFVVKPDRNATVVLLTVNSDGRVGVLYPYYASEARPLPAGQAKHIPGVGDQRIKVQEPFGMDMQFVFAFDEPPTNLGKLHRIDSLDPGDPLLMDFERVLGRMAGKFTFASSSLRTLKP